MADKCFAVVDIADVGAVGMCWTAAVPRRALKDQGDGDKAQYCWIQGRSLINDPHAPTLIYRDVGDGSGRSFRTGVGVAAVLRDREIQRPESMPGSRISTEEHDLLLGKAIGQLGGQITRSRRPQVGVIAADQPFITPSDRLIQQARRAYRADVTLIPWSVAAAAYWRDHCGRDGEASDKTKRTVACVLCRFGRVQATRVYLVAHEEYQRIVPLRDYESDALEDLGAIGSAAGRVNEWVRSQGECAGVVVVGGSATGIEEWLLRASCEHRPNNVVYLLIDHSSLACGAGALMANVMGNEVPYYASAPRVELCGAAPSFKLAALGRPQAVSRLTYWFDCLRGKATVVDGHRVVPANREVKWMSKGEDLLGGATKIECGRRQCLQVRLYGMEVRSMEVDIGGVRGQTRPCQFGCSYVVGSGRPTVYVHVPDLNRRFVLEWDRLEHRDQGAVVDLEHLHSDDEVQSEFRCRAYYNRWYNKYHSAAGRAYSRDPGAPLGAPERFHEWRRRFASQAPNPCGCVWCRS